MLHFIISDTKTPHFFWSFDIYYVFNYDILKKYRQKVYVLNDDVKEDESSASQAAVVPVHVTFNAAVATENNETSLKSYLRIGK